MSRAQTTAGATPGPNAVEVPLLLWLRHRADRIGPVGWVGLLAAIAAAVLLLLTELALRPALVVDQERLAQALVGLQQQRLRPPAADPDGPAEFAARLPPTAALPKAIEWLHGDAARRGLHIDRGDYRLSREMGGLAQRHQVTLPIRGDYEQLQAWLHQALVQHPFLAIDDLTVRRLPSEPAHVETRLQMSLYTRSAP